jgi:hypothetical protein
LRVARAERFHDGVEVQLLRQTLAHGDRDPQQPESERDKSRFAEEHRDRLQAHAEVAIDVLIVEDHGVGEQVLQRSFGGAEVEGRRDAQQNTVADGGAATDQTKFVEVRAGEREAQAAIEDAEDLLGLGRSSGGDVKGLAGDKNAVAGTGAQAAQSALGDNDAIAREVQAVFTIKRRRGRVDRFDGGEDGLGRFVGGDHGEDHGRESPLDAVFLERVEGGELFVGQRLIGIGAKVASEGCAGVALKGTDRGGRESANSADRGDAEGEGGDKQEGSGGPAAEVFVGEGGGNGQVVLLSTTLRKGWEAPCVSLGLLR